MHRKCSFQPYRHSASDIRQRDDSMSKDREMVSHARRLQVRRMARKVMITHMHRDEKWRGVNQRSPKVAY